MSQAVSSKQYLSDNGLVEIRRVRLEASACNAILTSARTILLEAGDDLIELTVDELRAAAALRGDR